MSEGRVFQGFTDLKPNFKPTFKVERNELLKYKSQRSPAWCDRILFKSLEGSHITPTSFSAIYDILTSDHKPVIGTFRVNIFGHPSGIDDRVGKCKLCVRNMSAQNLEIADLNGKSDPYVNFLGPFFVEDCTKTRSEIIMEELNPVWKDEQIPEMFMTVNSLSRLLCQNLVICVVDFDQLKGDDLLGCARVPFTDIIGKDWKSFELLLHHTGAESGTLKLDMKLEWTYTKK